MGTRTQMKKGNVKIEQVRVTTHSAKAEFAYNSWRDVSETMSDLKTWRMTKLNSKLNFSFANEATRENYNAAMEKFKADNTRDKHQKFSCGVNADHFKGKEKILVEGFQGARGSFMSATCYGITSLLLCTACFRTYFASISRRKK